MGDRRRILKINSHGGTLHYLCLESKGSNAERPFYFGVLQGLEFVLPGDRMLRSGVSVAAQLPRGCRSCVWLSSVAHIQGPARSSRPQKRSTCSSSSGIEKMPSCFSSRCLPLSVSILSLPMAGVRCLLLSTSQVQREGKLCPSGSSLALKHSCILHIR